MPDGGGIFDDEEIFVGEGKQNPEGKPDRREPNGNKILDGKGIQCGKGILEGKENCKAREDPTKCEGGGTTSPNRI